MENPIKMDDLGAYMYHMFAFLDSNCIRRLNRLKRGVDGSGLEDHYNTPTPFKQT